MSASRFYFHGSNRFSLRQWLKAIGREGWYEYICGAYSGLESSRAGLLRNHGIAHNHRKVMQFLIVKNGECFIKTLAIQYYPPDSPIFQYGEIDWK